MRRLSGHRPWLLAAMVCAAGLPVAFLGHSGTDPASVSPWQHAILVAAASAIAATASVVLSVVGARRHDGRTVLLSTAFSTMTALLLVHGLATPGVSSAPTASSPSPAAFRSPSARCCSP